MSASACPMAWLALAQAEATAKTGPRRPNSMLTWEAGALGMIRGTVSGGTRLLPAP